jgi:hypothetical protein
MKIGKFAFPRWGRGKYIISAEFYRKAVYVRRENIVVFPSSALRQCRSF